MRDEIVARILEVLGRSDSHHAFKNGLESTGLLCKFYKNSDGTPRCAVGYSGSKQMFRSDRLEALSDSAKEVIAGYAAAALKKPSAPKNRAGVVGELGKIAADVAREAVLRPAVREGLRRLHGGSTHRRRKRADPDDPLSWIEEAVRSDDAPGIE